MMNVFRLLQFLSLNVVQTHRICIETLLLFLQIKQLLPSTSVYRFIAHNKLDQELTECIYNIYIYNNLL